MARKSLRGSGVIEGFSRESPSPQPSPRAAGGKRARPAAGGRGAASDRNPGWSIRGAGANVVGNFAGQELSIAEVGMELAVLDDDFAAQDRHARPGGDFVTLPRRVIGLVQILLPDDPPGARVEQDDVGVRTDRQCDFARVETHDARRITRDEAN